MQIYRFLQVTLILVLGMALAAAAALAGPIEDLTPGHWYEVPDSRLDALDPEDDPAVNANYPREASWHAVEGVSAVIDDWNGGAFATGFGTAGGLVVFGGGHNGYFGNEIYVFDVALLKWIRVSDPVADPVCIQSTGELQDGSPCSRHTYDYGDYHPGTNSFVSLGSASNHEVGGGGNSRVHLYSFGAPGIAPGWRVGGASTAQPQSNTGASSAYDVNRDVFWLLPAYNQPFAMFDPNADGGLGQWTTFHDHNISIDAVSAIDPTRDILVTLDNRSAKELFVHDLTVPDEEGLAVAVSGEQFLNSQSGFEWDPVRLEFVAWDGGAALHILRPPDGDWRTQAWTWSVEEPLPENTVVPTPPNGNGTYSRFQYVPSRDVFIVVNRTNDNVFVYRRGGSTGPPSIPSAPADLQVE